MKREIMLAVISAVIMVCGWGCKETSREPVAPGKAGEETQVQTSAGKQLQGNFQKNTLSLDEYIKLGNHNMDIGNYDEAIKYYAQALAIVPENVNVRTDMGTCYRRIGRSDLAAEAYRKSLTFQPDHPNTLANLGIVLAYDMNDPQGAIEAWETYLRSAPPGKTTDMIRSKLQELQTVQAAKTTP